MSENNDVKFVVNTNMQTMLMVKLTYNVTDSAYLLTPYFYEITKKIGSPKVAFEVAIEVASFLLKNRRSFR